jgi:hypothetical protein
MRSQLAIPLHERQSEEAIMKSILYPIAAILMSGTVACSDTGPTGAGEEAATEVRVNGDAPGDGGAARSESPSESTSESSGEVEGSVAVAARVYLQTEAGEWVELTGNGSAEQTVEASGSDGFRLLARSEVEATSYHRVRVEFERVHAELDGSIGLDLGVGEGLVTVDIGSDGDLTVEREIEVEARSGAVTRLDIDLNTSQWAAAAASGGAEARSAFEGAVSIAAH